jgi:hypothetical protein
MKPEGAVDSAPKGRNNEAQDVEAVKTSMAEQKYFARRRRAAEAEKKTRQLSILNLCVSARVLQFFHTFVGLG